MYQANTPNRWSESRQSKAQVVRRVCELLKRTYGLPRFGNPHDPIDDLVYVVLSNRTSPDTARGVYAKLKDVVGRLEKMPDIPLRTVRSILKPAGLSNIKARQIKGAIAKIVRDFGGNDVRRELRKRSEVEVEEYLTGLPGVSKKVAKCVMMYTLGNSVLPVDTHVHRIASRLGWTDKRRADQCHSELEALVPRHRRYAFHVDCIAHGRSVCRPANPACVSCCIRRYCEFYKSRS